MSKITELDIGSTLLSTFILIGFLATAFVFIRLTIIAINYVNLNFSKERKINEEITENKNKGF